MHNIRLTLAYDGTDFAGWQVQPGMRTVQSEVESAVHRLTGETVKLLAAGRTDSGVHALGQVANFHTSSAIPGEKWRAALQTHLPADITVLGSDEVALDFHATYHARSKRYRYVVRNSFTDDPFVHSFAWRVGGSLDDDAMRSAAQALLGTHDFRCFESEWPNKATSVRTIFAVDVRRVPPWNLFRDAPAGSAPEASDDTEFLIFEIEADGFLYNMVRAIVGTLVNIGRGRWPAEVMADIIAGRDRNRAGETAPAHGLFLVRVRYTQ